MGDNSVLFFKQTILTQASNDLRNESRENRFAIVKII